MTDAEKWKKIEPLMEQLAQTKGDRPEHSPALVQLAKEICLKGAPAMLSHREITRRVSTLGDMVRGHILYVEANGRAPKDGAQYIFERALKVFYGDDIFDWYNEVNTGG
jgi:hypothetical protein